MTNAISKSTAQDVAMSLDQWLVERDKVVGQVKRLVRLWFINKLGSKADLSRYLQVHHSTVSTHVDNLVASGELAAELAPAKRKSPSRINREPVENSTTDDSESSNPITPGIVHDVTNVESSNTELSFCEVVSDAQPKMGTSYHGCSKGAVPLDTTNDRRSAEDLEEIVKLLNRVGLLTARNCDNRGPHFNEEQWYLVWASLDSEAREAKMRCRNYEAAIQRDCDSIRAGAQARFGS